VLGLSARGGNGGGIDLGRGAAGAAGMEGTDWSSVAISSSMGDGLGGGTDAGGIDGGATDGGRTDGGGMDAGGIDGGASCLADTGGS